jgi:hypothetical protein
MFNYETKAVFKPKPNTAKYCDIHPTSNGFIHPDTGKWTCWKCYSEDRWNNKLGKDVVTFPYKDYCLRMLAVSSHLIVIELWEIKGANRVLKSERREQYMSQAMRTWKSAVENLEMDEKVVI